MSCRGSHLGACACWKSETHLWSISQSWQKLIFIRQESSPPHSDYYYHFIIISTLSRFIPTNDRPLESKTNDYSSHRNEHGLLDWFSWGSIINSSLFTTANSDFWSAGTINLPTEEFFRIFHTDPAFPKPLNKYWATKACLIGIAAAWWWVDAMVGIITHHCWRCR